VIGFAAVATTTRFSFSSFDDDDGSFEAVGCTFFRRPPELEWRVLFDREVLVSWENKRSLDGETFPVEEDNSDPDLVSWGEAVVEKRGEVFVPDTSCGVCFCVTPGDVGFFQVRRDVDVSLLSTELLVKRLDDRRPDLVRFLAAVVELRRLEEATVEVVLRVERDDRCCVSELPARLLLEPRVDRGFCWVRRPDVPAPPLPFPWSKDEVCGVRLDERVGAVPRTFGAVDRRLDVCVRK
jgi:hypothetical protein